MQYNPKKWRIDIEPSTNGQLVVKGMTFDVSTKKSFGPFDGVHIRHSPIPDYVSKSDVDVWD